MNTKSDKRNAVWGTFLISLGLVALVDSFAGLSEWVKVGLLALGGLAALVIFLADRSDWGLLVPAYIMLVIAGISALALLGLADGNIFPSFVMVLIALPFLVVYFRNRENWWALIPAYVMLIIIPIILFEGSNLADDLIPTYIMTGIALPFLLVYFRNRDNWWALIPAYVLIAIGLMIPMIELGVFTDMAIPAYIMFVISIPFFVVYFSNRENWWALIPAGIMVFMGLAFLLGTTLAQYVIPVGLILGGLWILFRQGRGKTA